MKTFFLFTLVAATCFSLIAKASTVKKNVCSVTINSSHEIETFKKHLDPNVWNFIELTQFQRNEKTGLNQWLPNAYKEKVQCDILIISGHFAGVFFGESDYSLSMEELEINSCDHECNGILQRPKEVFLFGCNTLASKVADRRTPEEYMQVLLMDGFTQTQAQQVVAFRYS